MCLQVLIINFHLTCRTPSDSTCSVQENFPKNCVKVGKSGQKWAKWAIWPKPNFFNPASFSTGATVPTSPFDCALYAAFSSRLPYREHLHRKSGWKWAKLGKSGQWKWVMSGQFGAEEIPASPILRVIECSLLRWNNHALSPMSTRRTPWEDTGKASK